MYALSYLLADESGTSAVEYGMILAVLATVVMVALEALGTSISGILTDIANHFDQIQTGTSGTTGTPDPS